MLTMRSVTFWIMAVWDCIIASKPVATSFAAVSLFFLLAFFFFVFFPCGVELPLIEADPSEVGASLFSDDSVPEEDPDFCFFVRRFFFACSLLFLSFSFRFAFFSSSLLRVEVELVGPLAACGGKKFGGKFTVMFGDSLRLRAAAPYP